MATPIAFPSTTEHYSLPLLFSGQAQKEISLNQSITLIDSLLLKSVEESISTPPVDAREGSVFRITATATGDWQGYEDALAIRIGSNWHFTSPSEGLAIFDKSAGVLLHFNSSWKQAQEPTAAVGGDVIDVEARQMISELVYELRQIGLLQASP